MKNTVVTESMVVSCCVIMSHGFDVSQLASQVTKCNIIIHKPPWCFAP